MYSVESIEKRLESMFLSKAFLYASIESVEGEREFCLKRD